MANKGTLPDIADKKDVPSTPKWMYVLLAAAFLIAGFSVVSFLVKGAEQSTAPQLRGAHGRGHRSPVPGPDRGGEPGVGESGAGDS